MRSFEDEAYWAAVRERTVRRGRASRALARVVHGLLRLLVRLAFRPRIEVREHVPATGPVVVAPNHRSLSDALFAGAAVPRPARFLGMAELWRRPLAGRLMTALGGIPVRRGAGDGGALDVATACLEAGELLVVFPEGRLWFRHTEPVGPAKSGAGLLAVRTGAPVVGLAMSGTDRLLRSALRPGHRVQLSFVDAVDVDAFLAAHDPVHDDPATEVDESAMHAARELIGERVWPAVRDRVAALDTKRASAAGGAALLAGVVGLLVRRRRR